MSRFTLPLAIFSAIIFWASAFVGIRIGLSEFSPGSLALYRFFVGSVILTCITNCFRNMPTISLSHRLQLMVIGVFAIGVYNFCLNYGEISIDAGVASFIIGQVPVITIILSVFLLRESLPFRAWFGIVISIIGMVIIAVGNSQGSVVDINVLVIMVASACGAFYTLSQRRYLQYYHPVSITTWVMWGGTLSLLLFLPELKTELQQSTWHGNLTMFYLGIGPAALAYLAWCYVLNQMPVSRAALFLYALPLVSTTLGFVILNESPTLLGLLGGITALSGALLANYFMRYKKLNKDSSRYKNFDEKSDLDIG